MRRWDSDLHKRSESSLKRTNAGSTTAASVSSSTDSITMLFVAEYARMLAIFFVHECKKSRQKRTLWLVAWPLYLSLGAAFMYKDSFPISYFSTCTYADLIDPRSCFVFFRLPFSVVVPVLMIITPSLFDLRAPFNHRILGIFLTTDVGNLNWSCSSTGRPQ